MIERGVSGVDEDEATEALLIGRNLEQKNGGRSREVEAAVAEAEGVGRGPAGHP